MSIFKEGAATGTHQLDGPPRQNSSRCGNNHTAANALNQSLSGALPIVKTKSGGKMNQEVDVRRQEEFAIIEQVVMKGDLSKLTGEQRVMYYHKVCESVGLNPLTNPFSYLDLKGKLVLYANKDCSEQLRKMNGVSIEGLEVKVIDDIYLVTAKAKDKHGRIDQATGAVVVGNLRGEAKANAIMKAETKAKRRVTLSICGMGFTDESEIDSIPNAKTVEVDFDTGEIKNIAAPNQKSVDVQPKPSSEVMDENTKEPSRISAEQLAELKTMLGECEEGYRNWFYDCIRKTCGTDDLSSLATHRFDGAKSAIGCHLEDRYARLCAESEQELVAAGAQ